MNKRNILNISGLLSYIIFFIICERMIGCAGTGLMVVSFAMYAVLFIVLMGSVMTTLSKMVMARIRKGFFDNAKRVFGYCLIYTLFASLLGFCLLFAFPGKLGRLAYGDSSAEMIITCLGVLFLIDSFVRTIRGYYLGCDTSLIYIIAVIVKNVSLLVGCPILIKVFSGIGIKAANLHKNDFLINVYGAVGAALAVCVADVLMLLILIAGLRVVLHSDSFSFNEVRSKDGFSSFLKSFITPSFNVFKENIFPALTIFVALCFYCRLSFTNGETIENVYKNVGTIGVPGIITIIIIFLFFKDYVEEYRKRIRISFSKEAENRNAVVSSFNSVLMSGITIIFPASFTVIVFSSKIANLICGCDNDFSKGILIWGGIIILFKGIDIVFAKCLDAVRSDSVVFLGRIVGFICALLLLIVSGKTGSKISMVMTALTVDIIVATIIHGYFAFMRIGIYLNDIIAKLIKVAISVIGMIIVDLLLSKFLAKNFILLLLSIVIGYSVYLLIFVLLRGATQKEVNKLSGTLMYYPLTIFNNMLGAK